MNASYIHRFSEAVLIGVLLTALSVVVGVLLGAAPPTALEIAAVGTSYACTYLCLVQSRLNYPFGAVSIVLYVIIFVQAGLLASASVNAYILLQLIYGWYVWGPDRTTRRVRSVEWRWIPVYCLASATMTVAAMFTVRWLGGTMPLLDSTILGLSVIAQFLLDRKKIETWLVWMVVNIIAIWVYWNAGLMLITVQYVFFLGNAFVGLYMWRIDMIVEEDRDFGEWVGDSFRVPTDRRP